MRRLGLAFIAVLALVAAACGDSDPAEPAGSTTSSTTEPTTTAAAPTTTATPTTAAPATTAEPPTTVVPEEKEPVALGGDLNQKLIAEPNDGVTGGDTITVTLADFLPNTEITIFVCFEWPPTTGPGSCDLSNYGAFTVTTDAHGAATTEYVLQEEVEGGTCDATTPCMLVGGNSIGPPSETVTYGAMELTWA